MWENMGLTQFCPENFGGAVRLRYQCRVRQLTRIRRKHLACKCGEVFGGVVRLRNQCRGRQLIRLNRKQPGLQGGNF